MSEEIKTQEQEFTDGDTLAFKILLTKEGQVKIFSPFLNDKTACYGILEMAKDAVREFNQPKIIKPRSGMIDFVRGSK